MWECKYLFEIMISFPSVTCLEVRLMDHMVVIFHLLRNLHTLSHNGFTNLHSHKKMYKSSVFPTSSSTIVISCLFDNKHFNRCEVISYFGFGLHFSDNY